jgi:hypothetical protein
MATAKELGYNILLSLDSKKIAGTTSDTFTLAGKNEETIMKSDVGVKQIDNIGHEGKFSVNAYVIKSTTAGWMNVSDVMSACAINTGMTFVYNFGSGESGDACVSGTAKFLNFTINSDSEKYADMSIELQTQGSVTVSHY